MNRLWSVTGDSVIKGSGYKDRAIRRSMDDHSCGHSLTGPRRFRDVSGDRCIDLYTSLSSDLSLARLIAATPLLP